jgi:hypothetical protein
MHQHRMDFFFFRHESFGFQIGFPQRKASLHSAERSCAEWYRNMLLSPERVARGRGGKATALASIGHCIGGGGRGAMLAKRGRGAKLLFA